MKVRAILSSDWHLSHKAPVARSVEPDWYAAMKRPLLEISQLGKQHDCPVICAGDVFHLWNSPAELINFALTKTPFFHAIPGQHDLPHHNYDDIQKSAYWTLVKAGHICHLTPNAPIKIMEPGLNYLAFPWGYPLQGIPKSAKQKNTIYLAIVHKYIWTTGAIYGGSPSSTDNVMEFGKWLHGFDAAVVGDNHIGFQKGSNGVEVLNCGSLMCRHSDQRNYKPRVGLLLEDGSIDTHWLETSKDKWLSEKELSHVKDQVNLSGLLRELKKVTTTTVNFLDTLEQALNSNTVSDGAKQELREILESVR